MAEVIPLQSYKRQAIRVNNDTTRMIYKCSDQVYAIGLQVQITNIPNVETEEEFTARVDMVLKPDNLNFGLPASALGSETPPENYYFCRNAQIPPNDSFAPFVQGRSVFNAGDELFVTLQDGYAVDVIMSVLEIAID